MTIYRPTKYISFIAYCNKRKSICRTYLLAKEKLFNGELHIDDYSRTLRTIQKSAIELELEYFDVLHMRRI